MLDGWLYGIFGSLLKLAGVIALLGSGIAFVFHGPSAPAWLVGGIALFALGSYLKYVSHQTVRPTASIRAAAAAPQRQPAPPSGMWSNGKLDPFAHMIKERETASSAAIRHFPPESRDISNDAFKLYLIDHYKITKHDLLGEFVMSERLYKSLDEALAAARDQYAFDVGAG